MWWQRGPDDFIGEFVMGAVTEIVDEALVLAGIDKAPEGSRKKVMHPFVALVGYWGIGFWLGVMSVLVRSIATLAIGTRRLMQGRRATSLGTFWGGAGLVFGFALARYLLSPP